MLKQKLSLIYLPFLIIGLSFIGFYTLLNWIVFVKFELFVIKDIITNFGLPLLLISILALIWLNPRIKLLDLEWEDKKYDFYYLFAAVAAITLPTFITQEYLTKASGKLTELSTISSIHEQEKAKYYIVKDYFVSKDDIGTHASTEVTGKHNKNLHYSLFITIPLYDSFADRFLPASPAWLGIKYSTSIKNDLRKADKRRIIENFINDSEEHLNSRHIQHFVYLDRIGYSDDLNGFHEALKESPKFNSTNNIVLVPVYKPFEVRNGETFEWIFFSYGIGAFVWFVMLLVAPFDEKQLAAFLNKQPLKKDSDWKELMNLFIPTKDYYVTPILVNLNICIFLMMFLSGSGFMSLKTADLLQWGANNRSYIENGEYWRLLSSTFLHGGVIHLIGNTIGLLYVGLFLEPFLGKIKLTFAYLVTGVLASLASFYWSEATSVGASGAILGLYGLSLPLLFLTKTLDSEIKSFFLQTLATCAGMSLAMGFIYPGIDNAAHIGGFLSGCLLGFFMAAYGTRLDGDPCNA